MPTEDPHQEQIVRAYRVVFGSPDGQIVLADLVNFCGVAESAFDPNPTVHARNEGKRDVWMHIAFLSSLLPSQVVEFNTRNIQRLMQQRDAWRDEYHKLKYGEDDG
jgi:hypothetical protein